MAGNTKVDRSKLDGPHADEFVVHLTTDVNIEKPDVAAQTSAVRGTTDSIQKGLNFRLVPFSDIRRSLIATRT